MMRRNVFLILLLLIFLLFALNACIVLCQQEKYTYYGYVPSKIWYAEPKQLGHGTPVGEEFVINPYTVARSALLSIVAHQDNTEVKVFLLPEMRLVEHKTINKMEKVFVTLPNGTFFKVQTNKMVTVELLGGSIGGRDVSPDMDRGPIPASFYPATDGGYVGKEFIFVASQGLTGTPYRILALEDSEVTIYEEGQETSKLTLKANQYKSLILKSFKAYRVVSTGNIMVQSGWGYIPSVEGTFTGKAFYTSSTTSWDPTVAYGFQIIAHEKNAHVKIYDVMAARKIDEFTVPAGKNVTVKPPGEEIFIESDEPISVMYVHHGLRGGGAGGGGWAYGAGFTYVGVGPGETVYVYIPVSTSQTSFIFASEDGTIVTVNGAPMELNEDDFIALTNGLHEIKTTKNILIQITYWPRYPEFQAISGFGVIIPAVETVNFKETVRFKPPYEVGEASVPSLYHIIIVVLAVVVAFTATYYLKIRGRPRGSPHEKSK
ncbi:MAG: hypothetical protein QXJ13_06990 [Candidatus Bathyarchaeia archaeon]